jgi:hypothetical protein
MDILTYLLVLLSSFSGLIIGLILCNITLEELPNVAKYLKYFNMALLPLIIFFAAYQITLFYSVLTTVAALLLLLIFRKGYDDTFTYCGLGALFYLASIYDGLFLVSILIFIYGVSIGTITSQKHLIHAKASSKISCKENRDIAKMLLARYAHYIIVAIVFFAVFEWII